MWSGRRQTQYQDKSSRYEINTDKHTENSVFLLQSSRIFEVQYNLISSKGMELKNRASNYMILNYPLYSMLENPPLSLALYIQQLQYAQFCPSHYTFAFQPTFVCNIMEISFLPIKVSLF